MDTNILNDRLQLMASVGVIIGLVMVAFEIRQSSEIARNDTYVSIVESWGSLSLLEVESDFATIFVKSMDSPESLTDAELFRLGSWLQSTVQVWQLQIELDQGAINDVPSEIRQEAYYFFGNPATRAWYKTNRYWLSQPLIDVIDEHIATTPVGSDKAYFDRMRELIVVESKGAG